MKGTLAIAVLLAFAVIGRMRPTFQTTDVEKTYVDVIEAWKASEHRTVSAKAEEAIAFTFAEFDPEFRNRDAVWTNSSRTLRETILICYLDRLRDRFPSFEPVGSVVPNQRPPQDRELELEDGGTYDITRYNIAHYTVEIFLRDIRPILVGNKGELVVLPEETPSVITVDGYEIGRAGIISVEIAREHRIVVRNSARSCDGKVVVGDGASVVFHCP
jgi:hypothetical protein